MSNLILTKGTAARITPIFSDSEGIELSRYNYAGNELISVECIDSDQVSKICITKQEAEALVKWLQMILPNMKDATNDLDYTKPLEILK